MKISVSDDNSASGLPGLDGVSPLIIRQLDLSVPYSFVAEHTYSPRSYGAALVMVKREML